jgi:hypothetical protein
MAKETLSVDLDPVLIERVRRYSEEHGTDVADTISELIESLPTNGAGEDGKLAGIAGADWEAKLTPAVRRVLGAGAGEADERDYYRYLEEKYGR